MAPAKSKHKLRQHPTKKKSAVSVMLIADFSVYL